MLFNCSDIHLRVPYCTYFSVWCYFALSKHACHYHQFLTYFEPHIRRKSHARSWQWWIIFFGMLTPSLTRNVPSWRNWSPLLFSADFEQTRAHDSDNTKCNACISLPILWSWPPTTSWSPNLVWFWNNGLGVCEQRTQENLEDGEYCFDEMKPHINFSRIVQCVPGGYQDVAEHTREINPSLIFKCKKTCIAL